MKIAANSNFFFVLVSIFSYLKDLLVMNEKKVIKHNLETFFKCLRSYLKALSWLLKASKYGGSKQIFVKSGSETS